MAEVSPSDLRGLPVGVLAADRAQIIRSCDAMFCSVFACSAADVVGRALDELISPRDRRGAMAFATSMSRFTGELVDLLVTLRVGGRDHVSRLRIVERDGGLAVFAEAARGDADLVQRFTVLEQRWSGMFRNSADGIVVLSDEGRVIEHNARFFALMRFRDAHGVSLSEDAVVGRDFIDLVGKSWPGFAKYLHGDEGEFSARARIGDRHLELNATPLLLPNRRRMGTFVIVRDVAQQLQIEARDEIIQKDLRHARAFQHAILSAPPVVEGHEISVTYRPFGEVGGDIYDVALLSARHLRLFIADATGHGVPAALATMLVKGAYESVKRSVRGPAAVLAALNDRVAATSAGLEAIFTAAVVDVDLAKRTVQYSCGGHPPPLVVQSNRVEELEEGGAIVGIEPGITFPSWKRRLSPGAGLYLITDGITEARRQNGEFFGDARLHQALAEANDLKAGVGDAILARLDGWLRPSTTDDDVTILALRPSPEC